MLVSQPCQLKQPAEVYAGPTFSDSRSCLACLRCCCCRYRAHNLSAHLAAERAAFDERMDALEARGLPLPPVPNPPTHNHHKNPRVDEVPDPELDEDEDAAASSDDCSDYAPELDDDNPRARLAAAAAGKKKQQQKKQKRPLTNQRNVRTAPTANKQSTRSSRKK